MKLICQLAVVLTAVAVARGQYGPLKGPPIRRTTTPFPPGFQSDNEIYNGANTGTGSYGPGPHGFSGKDKVGPFSGGGSPGSTPGAGSLSANGNVPSGNVNTHGSAHGSLPNANAQPGAVAGLDNPWLSGIISQATGNDKVSSGGCSGGGYGSGCSPSQAPSGTFQQTNPSVNCNAPGFGCVPKHQCQGGQTTTPASGIRQCEPNTEVCCRLHQGTDSGVNFEFPGQSVHGGQKEYPGHSVRPGQYGQSGPSTILSQTGQSGQPGLGSQQMLPGQQGPNIHPGQQGHIGQGVQSGQSGHQGHPEQFRPPGQQEYGGQPSSSSHQGFPNQPGLPVQASHSGQPGHNVQQEFSGRPEQTNHPRQPGHGSQQGLPKQPSQGNHPRPGYGSQQGFQSQTGQTIPSGQFEHPGQSSEISNSRQPGHTFQQGFNPSQPGQPNRPGQSGFASQQGYPGQPGQGNQQGFSGQPVQTNRPGQTGQFSQPGQPGQPPQFSYGSSPNYPGQTSQTVIHPGSPGRPGQSGQPGQPGPYGHGSQQNYPGQSGTFGPSGKPGSSVTFRPLGQSGQQGGQTNRPGGVGRPGQPGAGASIYDTRPVSQSSGSYVTESPNGPYTGPLNTTPHVGCPAALKCVEESYCTWDGIMSDTPVTLTREQVENKVPLSECQNIETGIIGKCCRDPNYEDPWPADVTHGEGHGHGHHPGGQTHGHHSVGQTHNHNPQGTNLITCGASATCTQPKHCTGDKQVQSGKHCRIPEDGSTGVCCRKQFPEGSNHLQTNKLSPSNQRPSPGHQYYTPKPQLSKNPFLPENLLTKLTPASSGKPNAIVGDYDKSKKPSSPVNTLLPENNQNHQTPLSPTGFSTLKPPTTLVHQTSSSSFAVSGNAPLSSVTNQPQESNNKYFPGQTSTTLKPFSSPGQSNLNEFGFSTQSGRPFTTESTGIYGGVTNLNQPGQQEFGIEAVPSGQSGQSVRPGYLTDGLKPGQASHSGVPSTPGSIEQPKKPLSPAYPGQAGESLFIPTTTSTGPNHYGSTGFISTPGVSSHSGSASGQLGQPGSSKGSSRPTSEGQTVSSIHSGLTVFSSSTIKPGFGGHGTSGITTTTDKTVPSKSESFPHEVNYSGFPSTTLQTPFEKPTGPTGFSQTLSQANYPQGSGTEENNKLGYTVTPGKVAHTKLFSTAGQSKQPESRPFNTEFTHGNVYGSTGQFGKSEFSSKTGQPNNSGFSSTTPAPHYSSSFQQTTISQPAPFGHSKSSSVSGQSGYSESKFPAPVPETHYPSSEQSGRLGVSSNLEQSTSSRFPSGGLQTGSDGHRHSEFTAKPVYPGSATTSKQSENVFTTTRPIFGDEKTSPQLPNFSGISSSVHRPGFTPNSDQLDNSGFFLPSGQSGPSFTSNPTELVQTQFSTTTTSKPNISPLPSSLPSSPGVFSTSSPISSSGQTSFPGFTTTSGKSGHTGFSFTNINHVPETQTALPELIDRQGISSTLGQSSTFGSTSGSLEISKYSSTSVPDTSRGTVEHTVKPGFHTSHGIFGDQYLPPTSKTSSAIDNSFFTPPPATPEDNTFKITSTDSSAFSFATAKPEYSSTIHSINTVFPQQFDISPSKKPTEKGSDAFTSKIPQGLGFSVTNTDFPLISHTTSAPGLVESTESKHPSSNSQTGLSKQYLPSTISQHRLQPEAPEHHPTGALPSSVPPFSSNFGHFPVSPTVSQMSIHSTSQSGTFLEIHPESPSDAGHRPPYDGTGSVSGSNSGIYSAVPSNGKPKGPPPGYPFLDLTTLSPSGGRVKPLSGSVSYEPGKNCGIRRQVARPNGPGGVETGFGEFPWQAQILLSSDKSTLCSGAILSERSIVTSAHCLDELRSEDLMVKVGDWKLGTENFNEEPKPVQIRLVAAIARHPKYDTVSRFNDIAVAVLSEPLQLDTHVDVLCLGDDIVSGQKPKGNNCLVTGWGKNNLKENVPGSILHSIPVNFIESEQCENAFRDTFLGKYFQLNKSFTCILPIQSSDDLCQVDTGSPIACQKPDGRYELAGIYSWDVGCHPNSNVPSASANIDKKWLDSVMKKPVDQVKEEEERERKRIQNLGFNPNESDLTKPGLSQGYGK